MQEPKILFSLAIIDRAKNGLRILFQVHSVDARFREPVRTSRGWLVRPGATTNINILERRLMIASPMPSPPNALVWWEPSSDPDALFASLQDMVASIQQWVEQNKQCLEGAPLLSLTPEVRASLEELDDSLTEIEEPAPPFIEEFSPLRMSFS